MLGVLTTRPCDLNKLQGAGGGVLFMNKGRHYQVYDYDGRPWFFQIFLVSMLGGFSWICRGFFSAVGSKTSREIDEKIEDHFKNPGGFLQFRWDFVESII